MKLKTFSLSLCQILKKSWGSRPWWKWWTRLGCPVDCPMQRQPPTSLCPTRWLPYNAYSTWTSWCSSPPTSTLRPTDPFSWWVTGCNDRSPTVLFNTLSTWPPPHTYTHESSELAFKRDMDTCPDVPVIARAFYSDHLFCGLASVYIVPKCSLRVMFGPLFAKIGFRTIFEICSKQFLVLIRLPKINICLV